MGGTSSGIQTMSAGFLYKLLVLSLIFVEGYLCSVASAYALANWSLVGHWKSSAEDDQMAGMWTRRRMTGKGANQCPNDLPKRCPCRWYAWCSCSLKAEWPNAELCVSWFDWCPSQWTSNLKSRSDFGGLCRGQTLSDPLLSYAYALVLPWPRKPPSRSLTNRSAPCWTDQIGSWLVHDAARSGASTHHFSVSGWLS